MMGYFPKLLLFCAIFLAAEGLKIKTIKTFSKATDSLGLVLKVKNVIRALTGKDSDDQQSGKENIVADISKLIDTAKTDILLSIKLQSKLKSIEDAVRAFHVCLVDIKHVLEAQTGADELLKHFVTNYNGYEVTKHARFLECLLTYTSPGDIDLITLVREQCRCSDKFMNDFRSFYLDLILDGALLEISYMTYETESVDIQQFENYWANVTLKTDKIFASQVPLCEERFPDDIQTDLVNYNNPTELQAVLNERYPDKNIDMLFFSGIGTKQFLSFRYSDKDRNFFWDRHLGTINKMLIVTETDGKQSWDKASVESTLKKCKDSISVDGKESFLAADVLMQLTACKGLEFPVGTAIVYFEGEKFETKAVILHPDSPVVELSVEGVKMEYCFKSGVECFLSSLTWGPWHNSRDSSNGRLRVFLYPNLSDDSDFVTGGSSRVCPSTWLLIVAAVAALAKFQRW